MIVWSISLLLSETSKFFNNYWTYMYKMSLLHIHLFSMYTCLCMTKRNNCSFYFWNKINLVGTWYKFKVYSPTRSFGKFYNIIYIFVSNRTIIIIKTTWLRWRRQSSIPIPSLSFRLCVDFSGSRIRQWNNVE